MAIVFLDTRGMKCPQAIAEITLKASHMKSGDLLEVLGDGSCFENDIRTLCKRIKKDFVSLKHEKQHEEKFQIKI
jgi:TusA-related sulfurtransferase